MSLPSKFTISCFVQSAGKQQILHVKTAFDTYNKETSINHERKASLFNLFVQKYGRPQTSFTLKIKSTKKKQDPITVKINSNHFNYDHISKHILPEGYSCKNAEVTFLVSKNQEGTYAVFEKELLDTKTDMTPKVFRFSNFQDDDEEDVTVKLLFSNSEESTKLKSSTDDVVARDEFYGFHSNSIVDTHIDTGLQQLGQHNSNTTILKQSTRVFVNTDQSVLKLPFYPFMVSPDGNESSFVKIDIFNLNAKPLEVHSSDNELLFTIPRSPPVKNKATMCTLSLSIKHCFVEIRVVGYTSR